MIGIVWWEIKLAIVFGRDTVISEISSLINSPKRKIVEVWGVAGIGKTTVCEEALKKVTSAYLIVDARIYSTTIEIQGNILKYYIYEHRMSMKEEIKKIHGMDFN